MNFDPLAEGQSKLQSTISDLDLRSVTCVPLVRIRTALGEATSVLSTGSETVGVLYMDSRVAAADGCFFRSSASSVCTRTHSPG